MAVAECGRPWGQVPPTCWWAYCARHLYGRWIEHDTIMGWVLRADTEINPSGGPLAANPLMATGLIRVGEAFDRIRNDGRRRVLAHATSGHCLQQNLVCVLEGD